MKNLWKPHKTNNLGPFLRKARQDVQMSLRDVEEATGKEVSNAYLSQLESGKITKAFAPYSLCAIDRSRRGLRVADGARGIHRARQQTRGRRKARSSSHLLDR